MHAFRAKYETVSKYTKEEKAPPQYFTIKLNFLVKIII
jgi:hypothetical protein